MSNEVFETIDRMARQGWFCALGNGLDTTWECEFYRRATRETPPEHLGRDSTLGLTEVHYSTGATIAEAVTANAAIIIQP